jgi:hypothetical protein
VIKRVRKAWKGKSLYLLACAFITYQSATAACSSFSLFETADAVKASSTASDEIKGRSCMWAGAATAESGGSTCAHNSNNFGVLQLSRQNIESVGLSPEQYMSESLQDQIDDWARAGAARNNSSRGFKLIDRYIGNSLRFGKSMEGSLAACSQFGPTICNNDIDIVEGGKPLPKKDGASAIRCKDKTCGHGTANQDGNGHTIVSWGLAIQQKIVDAECSE